MKTTVGTKCGYISVIQTVQHLQNAGFIAAAQSACQIASSGFGSVLALTSRSGEGPRLQPQMSGQGQHIPVAKPCGDESH